MNCLTQMLCLTYLADNLEIFLKIFLFFIGIILVLFVFYFWCKNLITKFRFKREWRNNNNKFSAKRCTDEGDKKEGRDHIYLVDDKNNIYRIVNSYTLNNLGYPRPPRVDEVIEKNKKFYFNKEVGYTLKHEIEIHNISSIISTLRNFKN